MQRFQLSSETLDTLHYRNELRRPDAGGYVAFEGWVRNHHLGRVVTSLTYEAYAPLALKEGERIVAEGIARYDILDARAIHRIGPLQPGDLAVYIGVCAAHRSDAYEASRWLIDAIKACVPIWKHEFYTDGTAEWVDPAACHCAKHPHPHHPHPIL